MVAFWLWPLRVAVTMAFWLLLIVPEVAGKVALLRPDATVTLAGAVSNPVLLASAVWMPLAISYSHTCVTRAKT